MLPASASPDFALAASNAAAGLPATASSGQEASPASSGEDAEDARDVLDLLWFDPKSLPRVRKHPAWQPILDALVEAPPDPDIDAPDLDGSPARGEERRQVFEILALATAGDTTALRAALGAAVRADRKFVAPLSLLAGVLSLAFDPLDKLAALASAMTPLAGDDKALLGAIEAAGQASKQDLVTPSTVEALAARLGETYTQGKRALPLSAVEAEVEQVLLDRRRYLRRSVFGERHLRGQIVLSSSEALPLYLPEVVADVLPLLRSFSARLLVEAHLAADPRDHHPVALRAVALARSSPPAHRW
jgi:hypothetical protein